jgi:hypothetical protein
MLWEAIKKMDALNHRMKQVMAVGAATAEYELAAKLSDAATSALEIIKKYVLNNSRSSM